MENPLGYKEGRAYLPSKNAQKGVKIRYWEIRPKILEILEGKMICTKNLAEILEVPFTTAWDNLRVMVKEGYLEQVRFNDSRTKYYRIKKVFQ